jgi:prophage DNA circulation protein
MTILSQLLPASFRGVSFYVSDSSMDSGRKQVTHEFPNSDRRYVEDLGRFQNIYKMTGVLTGIGPLYFQRRDALIQALDQGGTGLLVHPFYGSVQVVPKQYTVQEKISSLGEAIFTLTFEKAQDPLVPQGDSTTLARIDNLADAGIDSFITDIADGFSLFGGYPNNFLDAQIVLGSIFSAFNFNTSIYTQVLSAINTYNSLLSDYDDNINNMIIDPQSMGEDTMGLFTGVEDLIASPNDRLNVYSQFYDFYDDVTPVSPTTFERIQRQANRDLLAGAIQGGSLIQGYRTASLADYTTIRDVNAVQSQLETQYQNVINSDRISDNTKYAIQNLRNESRLFFENEKLNVNDITNITTNRQPLTVLAYQYYGSTDNVDIIASLNDIRNNGFVEGPLDILSA